MILKPYAKLLLPSKLPVYVLSVRNDNIQIIETLALVS